MNIYTVTVRRFQEAKVVVAAETQEKAHRYVKENREWEDDGAFDFEEVAERISFAKPFLTEADLPPHWEMDCIPWGQVGGLDYTISELLRPDEKPA